MKKRNLLFFILFPFLIFSHTLNVPSQYSTIQYAINQSISGDTVLVDAGTYNESINFNGKNIVLTSHFILNNDTSKIFQTIIDGNGRGVTFSSNEDSSAQLIGFTIQNGSSGEGGGIRCDSSSPTLNYLIIKNNRANFDGGGIYAEYSEFTIKNSIIKNNWAGSHWTASGGGIALVYSSIIIENVQILNNTALDGIGGASGGGIYCYSSSLFLRNVLICNNVTGNWPGGGGIGSHQSNMYTMNSTISGNNYQGIYAANSNLNFINSICWNNQSDELRLGVSGTNMIVISHSDIQDGINGIAINDTSKLFMLGNNISLNPEFVDPNQNDYNLLPSSPCIDVGIQDTFFVYNNNNDTVFIPTINYLGSAPDLGAFEFDPATNLSNDTDNISSTIKLYQNFPNPFNSQTNIKYYLLKAGNVKIEIFNLLGQKIRTLINQNQKNGEHQIIWDGRDENNLTVASGIYIYSLKTDKYSTSKKILFLK